MLCISCVLLHYFDYIVPHRIWKFFSIIEHVMNQHCDRETKNVVIHLQMYEIYHIHRLLVGLYSDGYVCVNKMVRSRIQSEYWNWHGYTTWLGHLALGIPWDYLISCRPYWMEPSGPQTFNKRIGSEWNYELNKHNFVVITIPANCLALVRTGNLFRHNKINLDHCY